jgi:hypothetical protein
VALAPGPAHARTDAEIREVVQTLIRDRHPNDTPAHWTHLGPRAPAIMQSMYESENSTYRRMRILEGLGAFTEDPAARDFVKRQAEQDANEVVRHAALRSIGQNQGKQEEEWLGGFAKSDNPHTRLLAAQLLRKVGTESAQAKVAALMGDEKTPWVLKALKGEAATTETLTPSGSSEDRLSAEFKGVWRGYWIEPRTEPGTTGLKSEAAELKIAIAPGNQLSGELRVRSKPVARVYGLEAVSGKALRWSGKLHQREGASQPASAAAPSPMPRPEPISVEAELARRAGNLFLEIRSPQSGLLLILRRD